MINFYIVEDLVIKMIAKKEIDRHVDWNWEQSPDNHLLIRYHFVVVDDRNREGIMRRIVGQLAKVESVERVKTSEGKVKNSKFRYLFESYDSQIAPRVIDWTKVKKPIEFDPDLRERHIGSIEDYVADKYCG